MPERDVRRRDAPFLSRTVRKVTKSCNLSAPASTCWKDCCVLGSNPHAWLTPYRTLDPITAARHLPVRFARIRVRGNLTLESLDQDRFVA